ncbi:MAG: hypothetical protein WBO36_08980 [Saprospiraceae bacterium]
MEDYKINELAEAHWQKMSMMLDREMPVERTKNRLFFIWWGTAAASVAVLLIVSQTLFNPSEVTPEKGQQYAQQLPENPTHIEDTPMHDNNAATVINRSGQSANFYKVEKNKKTSQGGTANLGLQSLEANHSSNKMQKEEKQILKEIVIDDMQPKVISLTDDHVNSNATRKRELSYQKNDEMEILQGSFKLSSGISLASNTIKMPNTPLNIPINGESEQTESTDLRHEYSNLNISSDKISADVTSINALTGRKDYAISILEQRHFGRLSTLKNTSIVPSVPTFMDQKVWNFSLELGTLSHDYASILSIHGGVGAERYLSDRFKLCTNLRYRSFVQNSDLISNLQSAKDAMIYDATASLSTGPTGIFVVNGAGLTTDQIESLDRSILEAFTYRVDYIEGGMGVGYDISKRVVITGGVQLGYKIYKEYHFNDVQLENLKTNNQTNADLKITPFTDRDYHRRWILLMQAGTEIRLNARWSVSLKANYMPGAHDFMGTNPLEYITNQTTSNQNTTDRRIGLETGVKFFLNK